MDQYRDKFQQLLRELFQFDCADLDFGIYRIMNYKRDVIEKFISTDLPEAITEELDRGALADQTQAPADLAETAGQIAEALGKDALDADGNLAEAYHGTPLGKKYLELQGKAAGGRGRPFSYKLSVARGDETVEKVVDIPETFNYLLGLHVSTRKVYWNDECGKQNDEGARGKYLVYRGRIDHRQVVVIWRETEGWEKKDLERDKTFVAEQKLAEGADEVFVNGDSFIPSAKALEPVFKARMFSSIE
jgi:hypothetical protein